MDKLIQFGTKEQIIAALVKAFDDQYLTSYFYPILADHLAEKQKYFSGLDLSWELAMYDFVNARELPVAVEFGLELNKERLLKSVLDNATIEAT